MDAETQAESLGFRCGVGNHLVVTIGVVDHITYRNALADVEQQQAANPDFRHRFQIFSQSLLAHVGAHGVEPGARFGFVGRVEKTSLQFRRTRHGNLANHSNALSFAGKHSRQEGE